MNNSQLLAISSSDLLFDYWLYLVIKFPSIHKYSLEGESISKLECQSMNEWILILVYHIITTNGNLETHPDPKGFGKPEPSLPYRFWKRTKNLCKRLKNKTYFKSIKNYVNYLYELKLLIIGLCICSVCGYFLYNSLQQKINALKMNYLAMLLKVLDKQFRFDELLKKYRKKRFPSTIVAHRPLTNFETQELKSIEKALDLNKLKTKVRIQEIYDLCEQLNINPKYAFPLIILSIIYLRLQTDGDTREFIQQLYILLKMFGSNENNTSYRPGSNDN